MLSYAYLEANQRKKLLSRKKRKSQRRGNTQGNNNGDGDKNHGTSTDTAATLSENQRDPSGKYLRLLARIQPLQHAIQKDLIHLRTAFLHILFLSRQEQEHHRDEGNSDKKDGHVTQEEGMVSAFECFRQVARSNKLAALHRFVPPRCDVASFSQLLYATCLDLLEHVDNETTRVRVEENESHQEGGDGEATTRVLGCQAFAVFCLYLLHETNPLPSAPASNDRMAEKHTDASLLLSTLPMGLTNRQNPRLLYRRNYKPHIRVDPGAYTILLQLRHIVSCSSTTGANAVGTSIATDLQHVLDRLWPRLDLVAYKGPMGLHGLSQRQQLQNALVTPISEVATLSMASCRKAPPQQVTPNSSLALNTRSAAASKNAAPVPVDDQSCQDSDDDDDATKIKGASLPTKTLQHRMESYLSIRRELRLPPSTIKNPRFNRIRQAMRSMSSTNKNSDWEKRLRLVLENSSKNVQPNTNDQSDHVPTTTTTTRLQRPSRMVTFAIPTNGVASDVVNQDPDHSPQIRDAPRQTGELNDDDEGDRNTAKLDPFELVLPSNISNNLQKSLEVSVQTLMIRYDTELFVTAAARAAALRQGANTASVVADAEDTENKKEERTWGSRGTVASLSFAGTDTSSVGTSAVGRGALEALIAQAAHQDDQNTAASSSIKKQSQPGFLSFILEGDDDDEDNDNKDGNGAQGARGKRKSGPTRRQKRTKARQPSFDEISDVSSPSDDGDAVSTSGASTVGRRALEDLLLEADKAAASVRKSTRTTLRENKRTIRRSKKTTNKQLQGKKRKRPPMHEIAAVQEELDADDDENVEDDEESDPDDGNNTEEGSISGRGQFALQDLLSRALL